MDPPMNIVIFSNDENHLESNLNSNDENHLMSMSSTNNTNSNTISIYNNIEEYKDLMSPEDPNYCKKYFKRLVYSVNLIQLNSSVYESNG